MSEGYARPDIDILGDVNDLIVTYPPLAADRHHVHLSVKSGVVVLTGHCKTPINRMYLIERAAAVPGVIGVNADELYDDESIRLNVGKQLPYGVYANPMFGVVVLTGALPADVSQDDLILHAAEVPGVVRVVTAVGVAGA